MQLRWVLLFNQYSADCTQERSPVVSCPTFFLHGEKFPRPPAIGTVYLVFDVLIEFAHVFMPLSHIKRPGTAQFNGVRSYNFEVYDERIKPRNLTKDLYVKEPLINQQFLQFISMYKQHIQIKKIKVQENFSVLLLNGTNFEIWIIHSSDEYLNHK